MTPLYRPAVPEHVLWHSAVGRILQSDHDRLSGHLFLGNNLQTGLPVLVPVKRDNPHVWVMGGSGTGKTSRVLAPYAIQQLLMRKSLVVIDPKPDKAFFEALREECEHQRPRIPFRYVDITPGRWSYAFAPFDQSHVNAQTLSARGESLIQALNLDHGAVYGGSYYTAVDELFCLAVLGLYPEAVSPADIAAKFDSPGLLRKHLGEKVWEDSNHVRALFTKLAGSTPLNVTPETPGVTRAVLDAAIDMRQPFFHPQVIYFALDAKELRTTTRATIGLAFYNLLTAAKYARPEPGDTTSRCKVVCLIDEAQEVIGSNLSILLEQARSLGIELVLGHQNLTQLAKSEQDFRETLEENTGLQVVFNPVGRYTREWIAATSGEELHASLSWSQTAGAGFDPRTGASFHPGLGRGVDPFGFPMVNVGERLAPELTTTQLMELSAIPGVALVRVTRDQGYYQAGGRWVPVRTLYQVPQKRFEDREKSRWPGPNGQTVLVETVSDFERRFDDQLSAVLPSGDLKQKLLRLRQGS